MQCSGRAFSPVFVDEAERDARDEDGADDARTLVNPSVELSSHVSTSATGVVDTRAAVSEWSVMGRAEWLSGANR
jgi:hypothetical protein